MAQLMNSLKGGSGGGRGGKTRLALLLSLIWVAGGAGHSSERPASFWARLLGLPDPNTNGSRTVRSTWLELERRGFVHITPGSTSGDIPTITLLHETGSGAAYTIPRGRDGDFYFRVPQSLWVSGTISEMTGPGLVMYLIALHTAQTASRHEVAPQLFFPPSTFTQHYGMSETTRKNGLKDLFEIAVMEKDRESVDSAGGVGHRRRHRNMYRLAEHLAAPLPTQRTGNSRSE